MSKIIGSFHEDEVLRALKEVIRQASSEERKPILLIDAKIKGE